jgi:hypothetical protein
MSQEAIDINQPLDNLVQETKVVEIFICRADNKHFFGVIFFYLIVIEKPKV